MGGWLGSPPPMYEVVVGEIATVSETIEPGGMGRARLRGTDWTARNVGRITLNEGQRARIERVENLVVDLRAEEGVDVETMGVVGLIVVGAIVLLVVAVLFKTAVIVPQQSAYVIERLGRYSRTLQAGFPHFAAVPGQRGL